MIFALTKTGVAICAALAAHGTPCNGPAGISAVLRPLMPDASPTWSVRFDAMESCLDGKPCTLFGGMDCTELATFIQGDGRSGHSFVCRLRREEPTS